MSTAWNGRKKSRPHCAGNWTDSSQDMAAERLRAEEQLAGEVARRDAEGQAATEREQLLRDELAAARHENSVVQGTLKNVLKEQQVLVNEREALRAELAVLRESAGIARQQERGCTRTGAGRVAEHA